MDILNLKVFFVATFYNYRILQMLSTCDFSKSAKS